MARDFGSLATILSSSSFEMIIIIMTLLLDFKLVAGLGFYIEWLFFFSLRVNLYACVFNGLV